MGLPIFIGRARFLYGDFTGGYATLRKEVVT